MRWKEMLFAAIGGVVGAVLTMAAGSFSPISAQSQVAHMEFGTIICRELQVVGADRRGLVMIGGDEHGGHVNVHGQEGKSVASMQIDGYGGRMGVIGKEAKTVAMMMIDEAGGRVTVIGKKDEVATLTIDGVKQRTER